MGGVMPMYMEIIQAYAKYYGAFAKHIVIPKSKKKPEMPLQLIPIYIYVITWHWSNLVLFLIPLKHV